MSTVVASRVLTTHPHPHQPVRCRPSRADLTPIIPSLIKAWTVESELAREAYHRDTRAGRQRLRRALR